MALFSRIFGRNRPHLVSLPGEVKKVEVERVQVRTAEDLMIISISPDAIEALASLPVQLFPALPGDGRSRQVAFVPVSQPMRAVLDPNRGWIVPIEADVESQLGHLGPGEHELSEWLVIAVE